MSETTALTPTPEEWDVIARSHQGTASDMPEDSPGYRRHMARAQEIIAAKIGAGWFRPHPDDAEADNAEP